MDLEIRRTTLQDSYPKEEKKPSYAERQLKKKGVHGDKNQKGGFRSRRPNLQEI